MGRKPYGALDRMISKRKMILTLLHMAVATQANLLTSLLQDGADDHVPANLRAAEMEDDQLLFSYMNRRTTLLTQLAMVVSAAEPFFRAKVTYSVGPERYSFARLERQYGTSTSCKATFRFDLPGLKRVFDALKFPDVIVTPLSFLGHRRRSLPVHAQADELPSHALYACVG